MKLYLHFDRRNASTDVFLINGVEATVDDFGEVDIEGDGEWGVKSVTFTCREWDHETMQHMHNKYGIREDEFNEICDHLTEGLTWGRHR